MGSKPFNRFANGNTNNGGGGGMLKSFASPKQILILCGVVVVIMLVISIQMFNISHDTTNNNNNSNNNNGNGNGNANTDGVKEVLGVYAPNGERLEQRSRISRTKKLTDSEQMEENRLKAFRAKANEEERVKLLSRVLQDVDREITHIETLTASNYHLQEYVSIPDLPADRRPLDADLDASKIADTNWKLDKAQNPFLLDKPYIFIHIPKTGGSSLSNIFKRNERRDKFHHYWVNPGVNELETMVTMNIIYGHIRFGLHNYFQEDDPTRVPERPDGLNPYGYLTMLREPVDRVISHYYYHRQNRRDPGHALAMKYSFEEWIEKSPSASNEQARMLCGINERDYVGNETKTSICAHHHLKYTYKYVGITEKFSESLVVLTHYTGFQTIRYTKINTGTQRVSKDSLPENIIKMIEEKNQIDISLYKMALDIFEKEIDAIGRSFVEAETKELKKRIRTYNSYPSK